MSKQQAPFTMESFEASTRAEYGWSDRLPTLADLSGMLNDLADEIELGDTPRLKHLVTKVQYAAQMVQPIVSKKKHRRNNQELVEVTRTEMAGSRRRCFTRMAPHLFDHTDYTKPPRLTNYALIWRSSAGYVSIFC